MARFWAKSLEARLVGHFFLLSLVIIALAGGLAFMQARRALEHSVLDRLELFASLGEDRLRAWVEDQRRDVVYLASLIETRRQARRLLSATDRGPVAAPVRTQLLAVRELQPELEEILILSPVGEILASTDPRHEGEFRTRDRFFTEGLKGVHVRNVYPSPLTFEPTLTVSSPLTGEDGERLGVLAAHLNLDEIDRIIQWRGRHALSGESYLVDKQNVFVSGERFGRDQYPRGVHTIGIDAAVQGLDGSGLYHNYRRAPVIGVYRWIEGLELALLVEMPQAEAFAPARRIAWLVLGSGVAFAVLLGVGTVWLARAITRPILAVTAAAQRVAEGDLEAAAPVTTEDEVGTLAQTFNDMTARLRVVYDDLRHEIAQRQRIQEEREVFVAELEAKNAELERFTYTVSHDLKSPLFTIRGFLGLAEQDVERGQLERFRGDVATIRGAVDTMQRLLADLLELSRIGRLVYPSAEVRLSELAREAVSVVGGAIAERGVAVTVADGMPVVIGDRLRLAEVFQNLVENAVKFMGDQAAPRIEIGGAASGGEAVCFVRDNGRGVEPQYREKIFELFERLDHDAEGTGIGLALVKRIAELHGGRAWVESEGPGRGSTFYVALPRAS
ncbi:MAG TPA: ATP-binding protein [Thermoanaerobaculia bacterium]|jgi:signal transduction histidine kinase